jgi:integrase
MGLGMRVAYSPHGHLMRYAMTRYPKKGKGTKWSTKELDAIGLDWNGDQLSDSDGLFGKVRVNSGKTSIAFNFAFKWQGKTVWHYCGTYPTNSLGEIRAERDKARSLCKQGIDPRAQKVAARIEAQAAIEETLRAVEARRVEQLTFNDMFVAWIRDGVSRSDGNKGILQAFNKHAIPKLGGIEIRHITEHHLRDIYRALIAEGKTPTAVELSKDIGQMFRWAEKRKPWRALLVEGNPAELVEINKLVPADYVKERDRQLSIEEIARLKAIFDGTELAYKDSKRKYGTERPLPKTAQIAIWICLGTLCRTGELHRTEWKDVDFEKRTWFIPAQNTKGERGKKRDQLVHLSDFTLGQFRQLHALTGHTRWAFPGKDPEKHVCEKSLSKLVGDRQLKFMSRQGKMRNRVENNSLVLGEREWTPHDLRRTGATLMQGLKISREIINLCQNHVVGSKVDRSYLLEKHDDDKREAWNKLGDRLEAILGGSNVVSFGSAYALQS